MGKRSPRNNSTLAWPMESRALMVICSPMSSSNIDAVPICKRNDSGMVNKSRLDVGLGEDCWLVGGIANFWLWEYQSKGVRSEE